MIQDRDLKFDGFSGEELADTAYWLMFNLLVFLIALGAALAIFTTEDPANTPAKLVSMGFGVAVILNAYFACQRFAKVIFLIESKLKKEDFVFGETRTGMSKRLKFTCSVTSDLSELKAMPDADLAALSESLSKNCTAKLFISENGDSD